ncbi:MAG: hypothetical protein OIF55_13685 [Amphritea sp.]|nr:hypothetical protein [Amphritea sp.]
MSQPSQGLIKLIIMVLLPIVMCFGYYSLGRLSEASFGLSLVAVLSLPLCLLGLGGLALKKSYRALWISCIVVALAGLVWVWL